MKKMKKNLILIGILFCVLPIFAFSQEKSGNDNVIVENSDNLKIQSPKGAYAFDKKVAEKEFGQKAIDKIEINNITQEDIVAAVYNFGLDGKRHCAGTTQIDSNDDETLNCIIEDNLRKYQYYALKIQNDVDASSYEVSISINNHDLIFNIAEIF